MSRSLKYDDAIFGWKEIEKIYTRYSEQLKMQSERRTDIVKYVIYLDKYTKMNASYAKQVFSDKTICEVISHLYLNSRLHHNPDSNLTLILLFQIWNISNC